jgi:hypothetical protein
LTHFGDLLAAHLELARNAAFGIAIGRAAGILPTVALERRTLSEDARHRRRALLPVLLAVETLSAMFAISIGFEISFRQTAALFKPQQQMASQAMSRAEGEKLSKALALFAGQRAETVVFPVTFERDEVANEVQALLNKARWLASPVSRLSSPPEDRLVRGIMLSATGDDESQAAAQYLSGVLKETVPAIFFDWHPLSDPDTPRIRVYVGERPAALSD